MMIDLRSDTVTRPTQAMRQVMATAKVGDDVMGDDPTVKALERRTAEILSKPAAVYMPSGTMSNEIAIRSHTEPGDEIILEATSHLYFFEAGAPAALSGVTCRLIEGRCGIFTAEQVQAALRPRNIHFPVTKLLCVENTHNSGGGTVWPIETLVQVTRTARQAGLKTHLDGARLWNAAVASGYSEAECAQHFDSISVCFSKGLGAPVGSALVGSEEFIQRARRFRKMFGGGMRQSGIIAAGALYALQNHRQRLAEDHSNAKRLAKRLAHLPGIQIDPAAVETNIVFFRLTSMTAAELTAKLKERNVLLSPFGSHVIRAVTHLEIASEQIDAALEVFGEILAG